MLEIQHAGSLIDLPPDISFDLTIENPFMISDRIPTPYSLTFALPSTPANLALFSYPNRIASVMNFEYITDISIFVDGVGISTGVLKLDTYEDGIINAYYLGAAYIPNPGTLMYNVMMAKYLLAHCSTKSEVQTETGFYPGFKDLLESTLDGSQNFVCPPVRVVNEKQFTPFDPAYDSVREYERLFTTGVYADAKHIAMVSYLNFWNINLHAWRYDDCHMPNIMFPKIGYLFDLVFKNNISNNLFNNGELAKLVMINQYNPALISYAYMVENYGCLFDNGLGNNEPFFYLNSYMPEFEIGNFLKDMLKIFCISLFPRKDGGYEMAFNKDVINDNNSEDWTPLVTGNVNISLRARQTYAYGYKNVLEDTNDNPITVANHKAMYDISIAKLPAVCLVSSTGELFNVKYPDPTDENKLLPYQNANPNLKKWHWYKAVDGYVVWNGNDHKPEGTILQITTDELQFGGEGKLLDVTPTLWQFECINQGLGSNTEGDYDMSSEVSPLPTSWEKYWWLNITNQAVWGIWLVPVTTEPRYTRSKTAHFGIYHGLQNAWNNTDQYPYCSSHNFDTQGNKLGTITTKFDGPDGILNTYHSDFKAWINRDKKAITAYVKLDALALKNLDLKQKKNINGVNFFIEKIQVSILNKTISPAQVDLLES